MATNRILEFTPSQEEAVVARVLVLLHQAVDEHFPDAEKANRQFTKTVFSSDPAAAPAVGEPAASLPRPHSFAVDEQTGPGERPPERSSPVVQPIKAANTSLPSSPASKETQSQTTSTPKTAKSGSGPATGLSGLSGIIGIGSKRRDWVTIVTLILLVAGLVVLAATFFG